MKHQTRFDVAHVTGQAKTYAVLGTALLLGASLSGCLEPEAKQSNTKLQVTSAQWVAAEGSSEKNQLVAKGTAPANLDVTLIDPKNNRVLGQVRTSASGAWSLSKVLPSAPCLLAASTSRKSADDVTPTVVAGSAESCSPGVSTRARTTQLISDNVILQVNPAAPNGVIVSPAAPVQSPGATAAPIINIATNSRLSFTAVGSDPNKNTPLKYTWDFNGAAPNTNIQNPGNIKFSSPGIYYVRLTVTNSLGIPDQTPSERIVSVQNAPGVGVLVAPLTAAIVSPASNQNIAQGGVVNFGATVSGGRAPYQFSWDFAGAAPNSALQTPGAIRFTRSGTFPVRLTVSDSSNPAQRNTTPLAVTVSVANSVLANNQPPTGIIRSPVANLTIVEGGSGFFQAAAIDPDNNNPITYAWDFGGAAPASALQNPGLIEFTIPANAPTNANGEYTFTVKMTATDAVGAVDANPPVRIITVKTIQAAAAHMPVVEVVSPLPIDPIAIPPAPMLISATIGDSITFEVTATGEITAANPAGNPLEHLWTFAGLAPEYILDTAPPPVLFDAVGDFVIEYTATDTVNAEVTTVSWIVTVTDPAAPPPLEIEELEAEIVEPAGQIQITAGDAVTFAGDVENNTSEVTYAWLFPGGDPAESIEQIPGEVIFAEPGEFEVSLVVTDAAGVSSEPETVIIIVEPADGAAPPPATAAAPVATIDSPVGDVTITVGDAVEFLSTATDPNGLVLTYAWDFGPDIPGSTVQNPGSVTFSVVGVVNVVLTVTNEAGDMTEVSVVVTVQDVPVPVI